MLKKMWDIYREPYRKFATFKGRASLTEYVLFALTNTLIYFAIINADALFGERVVAYEKVLSWGFLLVLMIPGLAVEVRRLHDSNLSGGWILFKFVPGIGCIVNLIQVLRRGTHSSNQFGDPPKCLS